MRITHAVRLHVVQANSFTSNIPNASSPLSSFEYVPLLLCQRSLHNSKSCNSFRSISFSNKSNQNNTNCFFFKPTGNYFSSFLFFTLFFIFDFNLNDKWKRFKSAGALCTALNLQFLCNRRANEFLIYFLGQS